MELVSAEFPERWRLKATIAVHIRAEIELSKLSQDDVARICSITQPRVSCLLSGKMDLFSADSLVDIADRLGLSFEITCVKNKAAKRQGGAE